MRLGFNQARMAVAFTADNVRSISDARTEYQGEIPVKTSGSYSDALGNKTVYAQEHVGSVVLRADMTPDNKALLLETVKTVRLNEPQKIFYMGEVRVTETTITGTFEGMAE